MKKHPKLQKIKKIFNKQVVLCLLAAVIIAAGAINWTIRKQDEYIETSINPVEYEPKVVETSTEPEEIADCFVQSRIDRDNNRSKELEINKGILQSDNVSEETRKNAECEVSRIALSLENETAIENLIKAKGFDNVVAFITKDGVDIIVSADELTEQQVTQIKDIAVSKSGFGAENIKITNQNNS